MPGALCLRILVAVPGLLPDMWPIIRNKLISAVLIIGVFAVGFGVGLGKGFVEKREALFNVS